MSYEFDAVNGQNGFAPLAPAPAVSNTNTKLPPPIVATLYHQQQAKYHARKNHGARRARSSTNNRAAQAKKIAELEKLVKSTEARMQAQKAEINLYNAILSPEQQALVKQQIANVKLQPEEDMPPPDSEQESESKERLLETISELRDQITSLKKTVEKQSERIAKAVEASAAQQRIPAQSELASKTREELCVIIEELKEQDRSFEATIDWQGNIIEQNGSTASTTHPIRSQSNDSPAHITSELKLTQSELQKRGEELINSQSDCLLCGNTACNGYCDIAAESGTCDVTAPAGDFTFFCCPCGVSNCLGCEAYLSSLNANNLYSYANSFRTERPERQNNSAYLSLA